MLFIFFSFYFISIFFVLQARLSRAEQNWVWVWAELDEKKEGKLKLNQLNQSFFIFPIHFKIFFSQTLLLLLSSYVLHEKMMRNGQLLFFNFKSNFQQIRWQISYNWFKLNLFSAFFVLFFCNETISNDRRVVHSIFFLFFVVSHSKKTDWVTVSFVEQFFFFEKIF